MVTMHVCKVEGCEKVEKHRTVCRMHYERFRRNGHYGLQSRQERGEKVVRGRGQDVESQAKECTKCGLIKSLDLFHKRKTATGLIRPYPHCKECHKNIMREVNRRAADARRAKKALEKPEPINGGICTVEGCSKKQKVVSEALCAMHYRRKRSGTPMDAPVRTKKQSEIVGTDDYRRCTICDEVKPTEHFYKRTEGGFQSSCKVCHIGLSKVRQMCARYNDVEGALELANSYNGNLKVKALSYIQYHIEGRKKNA